MGLLQRAWTFNEDTSKEGKDQAKQGAVKRGVKVIRGEYHYTRGISLEEEGKAIYSGQKKQSMESTGKVTFHVVNSSKACASTELAYLIYVNVI